MKTKSLLLHRSHTSWSERLVKALRRQDSKRRRRGIAGQGAAVLCNKDVVWAHGLLTEGIGGHVGVWGVGPGGSGARSRNG